MPVKEKKERSMCQVVVGIFPPTSRNPLNRTYRAVFYTHLYNWQHWIQIHSTNPFLSKLWIYEASGKALSSLTPQSWDSRLCWSCRTRPAPSPLWEVGARQARRTQATQLGRAARAEGCSSCEDKACSVGIRETSLTILVLRKIGPK